MAIALLDQKKSSTEVRYREIPHLPDHGTSLQRQQRDVELTALAEIARCAQYRRHPGI